MFAIGMRCKNNVNIQNRLWHLGHNTRIFDYKLGVCENLHIKSWERIARLEIHIYEGNYMFSSFESMSNINLRYVLRVELFLVNHCLSSEVTLFSLETFLYYSLLYVLYEFYYHILWLQQIKHESEKRNRRRTRIEQVHS